MVFLDQYHFSMEDPETKKLSNTLVLHLQIHVYIFPIKTPLFLLVL